jgi:hypothetical protein
MKKKKKKKEEEEEEARGIPDSAWTLLINHIHKPN